MPEIPSEENCFLFTPANRRPSGSNTIDEIHIHQTETDPTHLSTVPAHTQTEPNEDFITPELLPPDFTRHLRGTWEQIPDPINPSISEINFYEIPSERLSLSNRDLRSDLLSHRLLDSEYYRRENNYSDHRTNYVRDRNIQNSNDNRTGFNEIHPDSDRHLSNYYNNPSRGVDEILSERVEKSDLRKRLIAAGFEDDDTLKGFYHHNGRHSKALVDTLSDNALKLLAKVSHQPQTRELIYQSMQSRDWQITCYEEFPIILDDLGRQSEEDQALADKVTEYLIHNSVLTKDTDEYTFMSTAGCMIITEQTLFSLFESDINKLNDYLRSIYLQGSNLTGFVNVIGRLRENENTTSLIEGLNSDIIPILVDCDIETLLDSSESAAVMNNYLRSNKGWDERVKNYKSLLRSLGINARVGIESDHELLFRIKRRENKIHPLNSMGISRTVGFEIEYPNYTPICEHLRERGYIKKLELIGFNPGYGDSRCDEASPGPFHDPETAVAVYKLYAESGIIDTDSFCGMTCHFNVDLHEIDGLVELVRSLYLTGAASYPYRKPENMHLRIGHNGDHIEGKVFSINTDEDAIWNLRSASYLSWALGAYQDVYNYQISNLSELKQKIALADVWKEYTSKIVQGLDYIGMGSYVSESENRDENGDDINEVSWIREQLKKIYPDEFYAQLPDLNNVGQLIEDDVNPDGILGIRLGEKWWPNMCAFAREITNEAVGKIISITDQVEKECVEDIKKIEGMGTIKKRFAIPRFLKKYKFTIETESNVEAFNQVKQLLITDNT